jgi:nicotinamide-nucleotide amidase
MQGEIITTGTELITGRVGDFNARYAARRLHEAGLVVQSITVLGDRAPLLQALLAQALARSQFIILTGGLGPTDDDITVAAAAQALNLRLFEDEALLARIRRCLQERGLPWEERYARLAVIPEGATVLDPGGSACGFSLKHQDAWLFFLPGVPR